MLISAAQCKMENININDKENTEWKGDEMAGHIKR